MAPEAAAEGAAAPGTRMGFGRRGYVFDQGRWRLGIDESPSRSESSLLNLAENAATITFQMQPGLEASAFTADASSGRGARKLGANRSPPIWRPRGDRSIWRWAGADRDIRRGAPGGGVGFAPSGACGRGAGARLAGGWPVEAGSSARSAPAGDRRGCARRSGCDGEDWLDAPPGEAGSAPNVHAARRGGTRTLELRTDRRVVNVNCG